MSGSPSSGASARAPESPISSGKSSRSCRHVPSWWTSVRVGLGPPRTRHDPGRVLVDLAVAIAYGAQAINDIAVLVDQPGLFGSVASDSTCWRLLEAFDESRLAAVAAARARAREVAWAQRAEVTGRAFARSRVA